MLKSTNQETHKLKISLLGNLTFHCSIVIIIIIQFNATIIIEQVIAYTNAPVYFETKKSERPQHVFLVSC